MKCYICHHDFVPDNYPSWKIGERKMVVHRCLNTNCAGQKEAFCAVTLDVVLPDNIVEAYVLPIKIRDRWCKFYSSYRNGTDGMTWLYCSNQNLLDLNRFYPINFTVPLDQQLPTIIDKLKTLLLFI